MGTIIKNTTSAFVDGQQITSDALNNLIDDAILNTTAVSAGTGLTVNASTGVLSMDTSLTGKTLTGGSLNNCPIGASTPNTGAFTTLSASGGLTGNVTGNVTGNLTGNVTGNVTGDVTGDVTGNISGNVTGGTGSFTTLTASDDANFDSGTLFVDASADRVGIGTTSPSNTLHIENTTSSGAYINYDGQSNTEFGLRVESNASGGNFESDFGTGGTALLDLYANSAVVSGGDLLVARTQSATPVLLVKGNGNVGINTESPAQLLDVNGQARVVGNLFVGTDDTTPNGMIEVYGGGTGQNEGGEIRLRTAADFDTTYNHYFIDAYQDDLRIGRAGGADITLASNGYVGIGTADPDYLLDINDDAATGVGIRVTGGGGGGPLARFIRDVLSSGTVEINIAGGNPQFKLTSAGSDVMTIGLDDSTNAFQVCAGSAVGSNEVLVVGTNGKVGIGETAPSAPLTVTSTTGGVLLPRMTTTQMNAISSPANGEMIYNTTANKFYGYAGGAWVALH